MSLASNQRGSAVVEFVLVAFPMLAIFVSTISLTIYSYARTCLLDATIEGVRFAALADQNPQAGLNKARGLFQQAIGSIVETEFIVGKESSPGGEVVLMQGEASFPGFGLLAFPKLVVKAAAVRESVN